MNTIPRASALYWPTKFGLTVLAMFALLNVTGCAHLMMMHGTGAEPPTASEFGLGPRTSSEGFFTATLQPLQPLRPRKMLTLRVMIADAQGRPFEDAEIAIDGGMPQHGHGLPTRPRVTRNFGEGVYEIEGVRFNMGGWWEFTLAINGAAGADRVTFNLQL